MNDIDILAHMRYFEGLPEDRLRELGAIAVGRTYGKGALIFSEGDDGEGFHVVVSGKVKIYKLSADGKEQILHIFGPGEPFGEVPVFEGRHFPAHAEAMEPSRVLCFPRPAFIRLIRSDPDLALGMLAVLSKRLRLLAQLVDDLSLKEVPGRLADHLLGLYGAQGGSATIELEIPKAQLASLLGTIPETLSRILARMSSRGLIDIDGPAITIRDLEGLKALAEAGGRKL